jgi:hypothetical protein
MSPQPVTVESTPSSTIRVPCPGWAHVCGESCLICDEDDDGTIVVIVTGLEVDALGAAARGLTVDTNLEPRLRKLDLLHDISGFMRPTEKGYALLGPLISWRLN